MRYGEGHNALYGSRKGNEFIDSLQELDWNDVQNGELQKGDIIFHASRKKTDQNFYVVTKDLEYYETDGHKYENGEKTKITYKKYKTRINRLTPTGKKAKNDNRRLNIHDEKFGRLDIYKVVTSYKDAYILFKEYKESNKNYVASGENRDNQKTKVYRSEWNLPSDIKNESAGMMECHIQSYIDDVITKKEFRDINPNVQIHNINFRLNKRRTGGIAKKYKRTIECADSDFGKSKMTILHEIAHFLAPDTCHGKQFTTNLLKLLKIEFPEAYVALKKNYDYYGVSYDE